MSKASVTPQQHKKNIATLEAMTKEPGNNRCCDCGDKAPRWASINLGCFVCIRCSGIHRNLGVHISKVRSINMDKWLPDQIKNMKDKGNNWVNEHYEVDVTASKPTASSSTSVTERYIRQKYEEKLWYKKPSKKAKAAKAQAQPSRTAASVQQVPQQPQQSLLADIFADPAPVAAAAAAAAAAAPSGGLLDLFSSTPAPVAQPVAQTIQQPSNAGAFGFGDFQSAAPVAAAAAPSTMMFPGATTTTTTAAAAAPVQQMQVPMLTAQNLQMLYNQPTPQQQQMNGFGQTNTVKKTGTTSGPNYNVNLNVRARTGSHGAPQYQQQQQQQNPMFQQQMMQQQQQQQQFMMQQQQMQQQQFMMQQQQMQQMQMPMGGFSRQGKGL